MQFPPSFSPRAGLIFGLLALLACFAAPRAEAQTLVYKMTFEKKGRSINFDFYDQAFFVVDGLGGEGSLVFTFRERGRDYYLLSSGAGELFFAVRPGAERAVIRATASNGSGQAHFLAIGLLSSKISFNNRGQKVTLAVSPSLGGSALASDSESDVDFAAFDGSLGFAGFADIHVRLERDRTRNANAAFQSPSQATAALVEELRRRGFNDAAPTAPGGGEEDGNGDLDP